MGRRHPPQGIIESRLVGALMAKFTFRLETLLKLRMAARDRRRAELAEAYEAEQILKQQKQELQQQSHELGEVAQRALQPGAINVDNLLKTNRYQLVLESQQKLVDERSAQLVVEAENRRTRLVDADRQVRVLEKLREKQQRRHGQEEHRLETKQIDDAAQLRAERERI